MSQGSEKNCAVECARTGFPVALLTSDGTLYIVTRALAVNKNAALTWNASCDASRGPHPGEESVTLRRPA